MGLFELINHLLNFVAPALTVGFLVALLAPALRGPRPARGRLAQASLNAAAGVLALVGGLWFFGNDGKMATYAAMLGLIASSQWWAGRGWKR